MPLFRNLTQTPPSPCRVTATCHQSNSGAISENLGVRLSKLWAAYSRKPRWRQRGFCKKRRPSILTVAEGGLALLDERRHALLLVVRGEERVEKPALGTHAFR